MAWLSIDIKKLVIQKLKDGWSQRKIAIQLDISRHGDHKTLENIYKKKSPIDYFPNSEILIDNNHS